MDAHDIFRIGIDFFFLLQSHLWTPSNPLEAIFHMTKEASLAQVDHISFLLVDTACPRYSIADLAGVFNDAQLDEPNILSKSSTYHARSLLST